MEENYVCITFPAMEENEKMSRMMASAFVMELNPTIEELEDIKTAVSEAVTNCILHAYPKGYEGDAIVFIKGNRQGREITFEISDYGIGIEDVKKAMEPFYTTGSESARSGMGFSFMEAFLDEVKVESAAGKGTKVTLKKKIAVLG